MARHSIFLPFSKLGKRNSREFVVQGYRSFSVLHALSFLFQIMSSKIFIASHDTGCHQVKVLSQRTGTFFAKFFYAGWFRIALHRVQFQRSQSDCFYFRIDINLLSIGFWPWQFVYTDLSWINTNKIFHCPLSKYTLNQLLLGGINERAYTRRYNIA